MTKRADIAEPASDDTWVPTTCYMCYNSCNLRVHRVDGVVVKIEGNPDSPHNGTRICAKGNAAIMGLYNPHRLTRPLRRTNPKKGLGIDPEWEEISWDEALGVISERLRAIRDSDPRKLAFFTFDTQGFNTIGKAFAVAFGTPNVTTGAAEWFCGNALHPVSWSVHGSFFMEPDYEFTNYALLFGSQAGIPAMHKNPIGLGTQLADARQNRGMKLVVVDPICSTAASKADEWVPIRPGTDGAMALAMAHVLVHEEGIYDREFLKHDTNAPYLIADDGSYVRDAEGRALLWDEISGGPLPHDAEGVQPALEGSYRVDGRRAQPAFELLKERLLEYTPEGVEEVTTVPAETIRRLAQELGHAASIGSTIVLRGEVLPHRPAVVDFSRGAIAHKHGYLSAWAIQLLDTLIGAVDVPGGHLGPGAKGPGANWDPVVGQDGLLEPAPRVAFLGVPYPPKKPARPNSIDVFSRFPASAYSQPLVPDVILDPKKYGLDYELEMVIQCRNNYLMTTVDPPVIAEMFAKVPFMVSFATTVDETAELSDIVLPDAHVLERLDALPNRIIGWILPGLGDWYWTVRQPVVPPPPGVKHWVEVLYDLAERMDMLDDLYMASNVYLKLKDPFKLKAGGRYSYEDVVDAFYKSLFGEEHGLDWFKEHGVLITPRTIQEAYPRAFSKARIPLYLEYVPRQGRQVKELTAELGMPDWDVSDYQALPAWRPCPAIEEEAIKGYDFILVNHKQALATFSFTVEMSWLNELTDHYPDARAIIMNPVGAQERGLTHGGEVMITTVEGKTARGRLYLSEGVHPEVVVVPGLQGHWARGRTKFLGEKGIHYNSLLSYDTKYIDMVSTAFDTCAKVKVESVAGAHS